MNTLTDLCQTRCVVCKIAGIFAMFAILIGPLAAAGNPDAVSAVGFVEPQDGVIQVSGSSASTGAIVSELLVEEGDRVEAGQIIALLDNTPILQAAVKQAEADVTILKARLKLVQAGTSQGTLNAQQARIDSLQIEIKTADAKCRRAETLRSKGVLSESGSEDACLNTQVLEGQLREARATLTALTEVREVDVEVARAELGSAEAALLMARAELDLSMVRAPVTGRVLKLYAKLGERIGAQGLLQLGQTEAMWIRAEVYETDIGRVQAGQQAAITSNVFPGALHGTVEEIGLLIGKNRLNTMLSDSRVVEVKIKLSEQDSPTVSRLTHLQVTVVISMDTP